MIIVYWIVATFAVVAFLLLALPCGTVNVEAGCPTAFLPMPEGMTDALTWVVGSVKWILYLAGDGIGDAAVVVALFLLSVGVVIVGWKALKRLDLPIIRKWI